MKWHDAGGEYGGRFQVEMRRQPVTVEKQDHQASQQEVGDDQRAGKISRRFARSCPTKRAGEKASDFLCAQPHVRPRANLAGPEK